MYILVVSIFDDVLGLSLLPFDGEEEEDALWVLGVETEETLIALSPVSFPCVVDVDLLLAETSSSVWSMLFVYLFPLET